MDCFNYPLDTETLLRKKRRLRKELLAQNPHPLQKDVYKRQTPAFAAE